MTNLILQLYVLPQLGLLSNYDPSNTFCSWNTIDMNDKARSDPKTVFAFHFSNIAQKWKTRSEVLLKTFWYKSFFNVENSRHHFRSSWRPSNGYIFRVFCQPTVLHVVYTFQLSSFLLSCNSARYMNFVYLPAMVAYHWPITCI